MNLWSSFSQTWSACNKIYKHLGPGYFQILFLGDLFPDLKYPF